MSSVFWNIKNHKKIYKNDVFNKIKSTKKASLLGLETGLLNIENRTIATRKVGFAWTSEMLRLKSNDDLKRLWYTILKHKNAVKSDIYYGLQNNLYSFILLEEEKKCNLSMKRIKQVIDYRETLASNTMFLFEYFHYKKEFFTSQFKSKFPKNEINEPMFSKKEKDNFEKFSEKIEVIKKLHEIDNLIEVYGDFNNMRSKIPNNFRIDDAFFLINIYNHKSALILSKKINILIDYIIKNDSSLSFKVDSNKSHFIALDKKNTEFKDIKEIKDRLYLYCKDYLEQLITLLENNKKEIEEKITKGGYKGISQSDQKNLLQSGFDILLKEINQEYFYIEVLNIKENKDNEFIDVDFSNSKLISPTLKRVLLFPKNKETNTNINDLPSGYITGNVQKSISVLNSKEIDAVEQLKQVTSLMSLLPKYVENTDQLRLKSKRKLIHEIQKGRSKIARDIFIKETAALAYKARNGNNV